MFEALALILARVMASIDHSAYAIPTCDVIAIHVVEGWTKYTYVCTLGVGERYVAPHFDGFIASKCNTSGEQLSHMWDGDWHLGGLTLHCAHCGSDGT